MGNSNLKPATSREVSKVYRFVSLQELIDAFQTAKREISHSVLHSFPVAVNFWIFDDKITLIKDDHFDIAPRGNEHLYFYVLYAGQIPKGTKIGLSREQYEVYRAFAAANSKTKDAA